MLRECAEAHRLAWDGDFEWIDDAPLRNYEQVVGCALGSSVTRRSGA